MAEEHHSDILLVLGVTPQWASARPTERPGWQPPGLTAEPRDLNDWREFVRMVATRYKGRIHAYEIWNEPNFKQYWSGTTDQLIALTREAYTIVKSIDSSALIVSPSPATSGGTAWLADFLRNGGNQYVDVIGYHFYVSPQPPEIMVLLIQKVQETMAENGAGRKPLWNTEAGWAEPKPFPSDDLAAGYLARSYILNWAAGVQRFYWYAWDNHNWVSLETTQGDNRTATSAGRAYEIVQSWLVGARMDWCSQDTNGTWTCQLNQNGKLQWIVWNRYGTRTFALPKSWYAISTTPLLGEPHLLDTPAIQVGPMPELVIASAR